MSLQYQLIEQTETTGAPAQQLMEVLRLPTLSVAAVLGLFLWVLLLGIVPGDLAAAGCCQYGARCSRVL